MTTWPGRWLPLVARVEWRAEGRSEEWPSAIRVGAESTAVTVVISKRLGPARAGEPIETIFEVRDTKGQRLRVRRRDNAMALVEIWSGS